MKTINANNCAINPAIVGLAVTQSDFLWALSLEQHHALENLALVQPIELSRTVENGEERIKLLPTYKTLDGIPSTIDKNLPPGSIELRFGAEVLARIENLAIPCGMER